MPFLRSRLTWLSFLISYLLLAYSYVRMQNVRGSPEIDSVNVSILSTTIDSEAVSILPEELDLTNVRTSPMEEGLSLQKRASPLDEEDTLDWQVYEDTVIRGIRSLRQLNGGRRVDQNVFAAEPVLAFEDNGWRQSDTPVRAVLPPPHTWLTALSRFFAAMGVPESPLDNNEVVCVDHVHQGTTQHAWGSFPRNSFYNRTNAQFHDAYNVNSGVITSLVNYSPQDWLRERESVGTLPPLHRYADVAAAQWALQTARKPGGQPLRYWIRYDIQEDHTGVVMDVVRRVHDITLYDLRGAGRAFPTYLEIGRALVGTPFGQDVALALAANVVAFGGDKTIESVRIGVQSNPWRTHYALSLAFVIVDVASKTDLVRALDEWPAPVAEDWWRASTRGSRNLLILAGVPSSTSHELPNVSPNPFVNLGDPEQALNDNGWDVGARPPGLAGFPLRLHYLFEILDLSVAPTLNHDLYVSHASRGETSQRWGDHAPGTAFDLNNAHFYNILNIVSGVIVSMNNYSPNTWKQDQLQRQLPEPRLPPLHQFSEVIGTLWAWLIASSGQDATTLRYWLRFAITAPTLDVIRLALHSDGMGLDDIPIDGVEYDSATDIGRALLGTAEGNGVAWTLATNEDAFGVFMTVENIVIYRARLYPDLDANDPADPLCLVFGIGPRIFEREHAPSPPLRLPPPPPPPSLANSSDQ